MRRNPLLQVNSFTILTDIANDLFPVFFASTIRLTAIFQKVIGYFRYPTRNGSRIICCLLLLVTGNHVISQTNVFPQSGSVGIGTTTPGAKLSIVGTRQANYQDGILVIADDAPMAAGVGGGLMFIGKYTTGGAPAGAASIWATKENNIDADYAFSLNLGSRSNASSSISPNMTINSLGNVGIGTSAPLQKLHLTGGGIQVSNTNSAFVLLESTYTGGRAWSVLSVTDGSVAGPVGSFAIMDQTAATTRMIIDNTGNVGIGTTNPQAKLAVKGNVLAEKMKISIAPGDWPDYVFQRTYKLRSLSELEKFIQKNNHLPEVPSAVEIEKQGLDIGDGQAMLLKKIEELTLYLIDQNKKIAIQNKKIDEQNRKIALQQTQIHRLIDNSIPKKERSTK